MSVIVDAITAAERLSGLQLSPPTECLAMTASLASVTHQRQYS
jgi:hypothetical protein